MAIRGHGGDLAAAMARFGGAAADWLDLSTGINPNPWPVPDLPARCWSTLPGQPELDALVAAARAAYGVHPGNAVLAAPGTQALIQQMPALSPALDARIVGPTYNEHAGVFRDSGHPVREVATLAGLDGAGVAIVVNPNNPDGRAWPVADVLTVRAGLLVIDEAFADVMPRVSACARALPEGVVVLRSFGKFFGLAGLRLGFAVAAPATAVRLRQRLGPWAVSGPALWIGAAALADDTWIAATRARLAGQMTDLRAVLSGAGLQDVGGTDLFTTAAAADAANLQARLAARRIWTRTFDYRPDWIRFGLPADRAGMDRLREALA